MRKKGRTFGQDETDGQKVLQVCIAAADCQGVSRGHAGFGLSGDIAPSSQRVAVTRACVHEERSSAEREMVVVVVLVLKTWGQVLLFFTFLVDSSKPLAFPYSASPKWRRPPVLGRVFSGVKAGLGYSGTLAYGAEHPGRVHRLCCASSFFLDKIARNLSCLVLSQCL